MCREPFRGQGVCLVVCFSLVLLFLGVGPADAQSFGTREDAEALLAALGRLIRQDGVDAGVAAVQDATSPFAATSMGVHVLRGPIVLADSREPETASSSYERVADRDGRQIWEQLNIALSSADRTDVTLNWYHYDTSLPYDFECLVEKVKQPDYIVMICR